MAITITRLQSLVTSTNSTSYSLSAYTPTIDTLQVAIVHAPGTISGPFSMGDGGSTYGWVRRTTLTYDSISAPSGVLMFFTAFQQLTPVSMTPSFSCTADAATGCMIALYEIAGINLEAGPPELDPESHVDGGCAIGGITYTPLYATDTEYPASDGSADPTIGPGSVYASGRKIRLNTNNAYLIGIANNRNTAAYTAPSGWTEDLDVGITGPAAGLWVGYRISGEDDVPTITVTGATAPWAAIFLEFCAPGEYPRNYPRDSNMGESGFFGT